MKRLLPALAGVVLAILIFPEKASAHDCSSLSDCFGVMQAALAAAAALAGIAISLGLDLIPGIGTGKGVIEAFSGRDMVTGEELAWWERILGVVPIAPALVGGAVVAARGLRRFGEALEAATDIGRAADRVGDAASAARAADRVGDVAGMARRTDMPSAGRSGILDEVDEIDPTDWARRPMKCFVAGTLVRRADGRLSPVELIEKGDRVASASGGARRARVSSVLDRAVVETLRADAPWTMRLTFSDPDGTEIRVTPGHFLATPDGYRRAGHLEKGASVLRRDGRTVSVASNRAVRGRIPVYNLEVEEDHCYFASELEILAHNPAGDCTEFRSQMDAEKLLEKEGFGFLRKDKTYGPRNRDYVREPVFKDHDFRPDLSTRRPRGGPRRGTLEHYRGTVKKGTTRPDIYGEEAGRIVSYEIKTPKTGSSVEKHFLDNQDTILDQVRGRYENMPRDISQRAMIDLRHTGQDVTSAMKDFQNLSQRGDYGAFFERYGDGVRFITEGADGVPRLSELKRWEEVGIMVGGG